MSIIIQKLFLAEANGKYMVDDNLNDNPECWILLARSLWPPETTPTNGPSDPRIIMIIIMILRPPKTNGPTPLSFQPSMIKMRIIVGYNLNDFLFKIMTIVVGRYVWHL